MADLEELALKRDRGYLVRLVLALLVGVVVSVFLFRGLTGKETTGCLASTLVGSEPDTLDTASTPNPK